MDVVLLSRIQFGVTAAYHFLFVPLTLGLAFLIAIMESVYVMTRKDIWKQMTKFWGSLFGINFAMGVATGIPLEFQFGTNWAYYSHYVGDIFGSLLALEGLMAFFLEATLIGLFFFAWDRLSKVAHLMVTWGLALATSFSALWILIANAWMQNPVGAKFNRTTMRMELDSFYDVFFNPVAQSKFVHTISAGYVTGAVFVIAISAYYLLRERHIEFAKRSFMVAASFGLASALSVVVLGDESGYTTSQNQKMKMAAMESMWNTEKPPASLLVFAIPDMKNKTNHYEIKIPYLLGLIATRSFSQPVYGINDLVDEAKHNIKKGKLAVKALEDLQKDPKDNNASIIFEDNQHMLGYGLLLKRYINNVIEADETLIQKAAENIIPNVLLLFWSFRVMVAIGLYFIGFFIYAFYLSAKRKILTANIFLHLSCFTLPLPWIAALFGWFLAEHGRQPWAIEGVLPTFLAASKVDASYVLVSLTSFIIFYTGLLIVDIFLLKKYIKQGPN